MAILGIGLIAFSLKGAGTPAGAEASPPPHSYVVARQAASLAEGIGQITVHVDSHIAPHQLVAGAVVDVIANDAASDQPVVIAPHVNVIAVNPADGDGLAITINCRSDLALAIAGVQLNNKPLAVVRVAGN